MSNRRRTRAQTGRNRKTQKPRWIIKPKHRYYFQRKPKTENRMLKKGKIRKPQRKHQNRKTAVSVLAQENRKNGLKNSQNRKFQCSLLIRK